MLRRSLAPVALAGLLLCAPLVHAGRSCEDAQPPQAKTIERGLDLAVKTLHALDASGAKVVVLARAGQDLTKYRLRYSHLGFAYRIDDAQGGHVWRVLHKLNECGSAQADIYRQGLGEFFLDDPWRFQAAWVVPTPQVQEQLHRLLLDEALSLQLHQRAYSMVAYPWSTTYQQSNQWAIETLAMAVTAGSAQPVTTREEAQDWLREARYQPSVLTIGAFTRLGARLTAANVAFDDHPDEKRFADRIETVTVDSVFAWMPRAGLTTQALVVLR
jgi:hypothetical protein